VIAIIYMLPYLIIIAIVLIIVIRIRKKKGKGRLFKKKDKKADKTE
jgi:preprotein translocase subunit SecG